MKQHGLTISLLAALLIGGCGKTKGGAVIAKTPLSQDLRGYRTMGVYFLPIKPEFREGLGHFRSAAMTRLQQAGIVSSVSEVGDISRAPGTDLLLSVTIHDYVKSNAGFWVRGGFARQAKIIMVVGLMDMRTGKILTTGEVGAWTFKNKSNKFVNDRAANNLVRFLRREYDRTAEPTTTASPVMPRTAIAAARPAPVVAAAGGAPVTSTPGCTKDTDCPGDAVCERSRCVTPARSRAPAPTPPTARTSPAAALAPAAGCAADGDCPGKKICEQGRCHSLMDLSPAELRRRRNRARMAKHEERRQAAAERRRQAAEARADKQEARRRAMEEKRRLAMEEKRRLAEEKRRLAGEKRRRARERRLTRKYCKGDRVYRDGGCVDLREQRATAELRRSAADHDRSCRSQRMISCARIAKMLRTGSGVKKNPGRARKLFLKDCRGGGKRGRRHSCVAFGEMALAGEGGPRDPALAKDAFSKACVVGPEGCASLGKMFCKGIGVVRSSALCDKYLRRACSGGHRPSCR